MNRGRSPFIRALINRARPYFAKGAKAGVPADMTKKQLRDDVIKIAWPALTEFFLVQLLSMIDTIMCGRMLGAWSIA